MLTFPATGRGIEEEFARIKNTSPLPLSYYFDERYVSFRQQLERRGVRYLGIAEQLHSDLPSVGDYKLLKDRKNAEMLVRTEAGLRVRSNVCRHQHALIVDPVNRCQTDKIQGNLACKGKGKSYMCPFHAWRYSIETGKLESAPHFPQKPQESLPERAVTEFFGMMLDVPEPVADDLRVFGYSGLFDPNLVDLKDYSYVGEDPPRDYECSLEVFMRAYFDLYHVQPYHPTSLAAVTDCRKMAESEVTGYWEFGRFYSVQIAPWKTSHKMSDAYRRQVSLIDDLYLGKPPPHSAIWLALFPGFMIEWYPHILLVSTLHFTGKENCRNHIRYFVRKEWSNRASEILEIARQSFEEWLNEDDEIVLGEHAGQKALWEAGDLSVGYLHPSLEFGVMHFYDYIQMMAVECGLSLSIR
jgi:choline monooxygenase